MNTLFLWIDFDQVNENHFVSRSLTKAEDIKTHSSIPQSNIFWGISEATLIFGMHDPFHKPFQLVPCLHLDLFQGLNFMNLLHCKGPQSSKFACLNMHHRMLLFYVDIFMNYLVPLKTCFSRGWTLSTRNEANDKGRVGEATERSQASLRSRNRQEQVWPASITCKIHILMKAFARFK